ncbi:hypothetical protein [Erythrobacter sp. JK5]|uniref:hypothetical protein n=1 Tax=Erythrobacter sp. JK5 TaxID=2829500 RepID=UPI001BA9BEA5|nr:hypothetical protein [Erythrobacter sp. JK5]QUL38214.1 hypothetical protein KDC96_01970 [Erythrobacter sp. JK5]
MDATQADVSEPIASAEPDGASTSGAASNGDTPADASEAAAASGERQDTIPARFHGTYAETTAACDIRAHGRFTVSADRIQFFESAADVLGVRVDGDYAAVDAEETYADQTGRYVFYMALEGEDRLRYRYDRNERMTWVRCP